jgi:hypothetical protein
MEPTEAGVSLPPFHFPPSFSASDPISIVLCRERYRCSSPLENVLDLSIASEHNMGAREQCRVYPVVLAR